MPVRVTTAAESAARDRAAIEEGIPSRALMRCAGLAAAGEITRRYPDRLARGVAVFAGPGNNGGDAWVVAGLLAAAGVRVRVTQVDGPRSQDARDERAHTLSLIEPGEPHGGEEIVIDGLLGTGATGVPRAQIAGAIARIATLREYGALVIALDIPSGVDATTGAAEQAVRADVTLTFGTIKRGLLLSRQRCGRIIALDIGLGPHAGLVDGAPLLVDAGWARARIPGIPADAHKGVRRRLTIIGGGPGMAGAAMLAARAAARSGIGLTRLIVAPENVAVVQAAAPDSLAAPWPVDDAALARIVDDWSDGIVLGPGLGASPETRRLAERVLGAWRGPVVVDADALNVFAGDVDALGALLAGRPALVTPHPAECARLTGQTTQEVLDARFALGPALAGRLNAVVLLKGVPTVVSAPTGEQVVVAAGTPALAAAGSGDLLAGIAGTLVTQTGDAFAGGAIAAWIHGRAGLLATRRAPLRGVDLNAVAHAIPAAWRVPNHPSRAPVLAELPAVGDG